MIVSQNVTEIGANTAITVVQITLASMAGHVTVHLLILTLVNVSSTAMARTARTVLLTVK